MHEAVLKNERGARYRAWVVEVARAVTDKDKRLVICTPLGGSPELQSLWQELSRISGVRLGTETQITSDHETSSVRDRLAQTVEEMQALGIPASKLVHVANLATTSEAYDYGSSGTSRADMKRFRANAKAQVAAANTLGYGGAMGYGFRVPKGAQDTNGNPIQQPSTASRVSVVRAWNAAWKRVEHRDSKSRYGAAQVNT